MADAIGGTDTGAGAGAPTSRPGRPAPHGAPRTVWATRVPGNFEQALHVRRGGQRGHGSWSWSVQQGRYRIELRADASGATVNEGDGRSTRTGDGRRDGLLNWASSGGLDEHGLAPERFTTHPSRGGARAVNFQRDTGLVSYSGPTGQMALVPGAQDRLSWLVQLLALVQAQAPGQGLPARLPLWVAGPQGDGGDWWFDVKWDALHGCWHFSRQAERRFDVQVQVWLAREPSSRLVRLVMGAEGGRQAPWQLQDAADPGRCGPLP